MERRWLQAGPLPVPGRKYDSISLTGVRRPNSKEHLRTMGFSNRHLEAKTSRLQSSNWQERFGPEAGDLPRAVSLRSRGSGAVTGGHWLHQVPSVILVR